MKQSDNKILVIGAYGFIGAHIVTRLLAGGFQVSGLGRHKYTAEKVLPGIKWHIADIAKMTSPDDWHEITKTYPTVINCAGALQDGGNDDLEAVHFHAVKALTDACLAHDTKLIQISAVGAELDANTPFMRTKAMGDNYIRKNAENYVIFRPGLVLAKNAYGGSALLRMLAAFPLIQPIALKDAKVQCTSIDDLSLAVQMAVAGEVTSNSTYDLVETEIRTLGDVVAETRKWLGFSPAKWQVPLPDWIVSGVAKLANALGHLGWRSPLRSNAIKVLQNGIIGEAAPWRDETGKALRSLDQANFIAPAAAEDRLFARISLLMPVVVFTLSIFWLISGIIGFWQIDRAASVLTATGWQEHIAKLSVGFWSIVDIALGLGILIRKFAKVACGLMIFVSVIYLVSAAMITPQLWSDPLGPMIKVLPAIILAQIAHVSLENR